MGSKGKKKTTMAKLARESRLRERRVHKQAKKDARRQASTDPLNAPGGALHVTAAGAAERDPAEPAPEPVVHPLADAD
jgi:hypothetical protein